MKRAFHRLLSIFMVLLLTAAATGCGKQTTDINAEEILSSLLSQVRYDTELKPMGETGALYFPDLPEGSTVSLYAGSGYYADEVALLTLPSADKGTNAMQAVDNHIAEVRRQFASYIPAEVEKIDRAVTRQNGKYIFVCITNDYSSANLILDNASDSNYRVPATGESADASQTTPTIQSETTPTVQPETKPQEQTTEKPSYPVLQSKSGSFKRYPSATIRVDDSLFELYTYRDAPAQTYADIVNRVADALAGKTQVYALTIPTAIGIALPDDIAKILPEYSDQGEAIEKIFAKLNSNVKPVHCFDNLMQHRDENLYFSVDHHWNGNGAYYAYEAFCQTKGITPYTMAQRKRVDFTDFKGSLYAQNLKQDPSLEKLSDTVTAYYPVSANASMTFTDGKGKSYPWNIISDVTGWKVGTKYSTFAGGDNPISVFKNPDVKDNSVCIIVKESYGNALLPYFVDHYSTIYEIDYRYWKGNLVEFAEENKANDLIFANNTAMIATNMHIAKLSSICG